MRPGPYIPRALSASGRKPYQKYQNNDTEIVAGIGRAWTQPVGQDSGIGDAQGDQYPGEEGEQGKEPPLLFQRYPGLEIGDQRDIDAGGEPADQKLEGEEEDKVKLWSGTQKGRGQTKGGHQGAVDQKQGAQVFQGAEAGRPDQEQAGQQGSGGGGGDRQAVSGLWKLVQLHQNAGEDDLLAVGYKKVEGHHQKKEGEQFPPAQQISNTGQQAGRFRLLDGARRVGNEALLEGGEAVGQRAQQEDGPESTQSKQKRARRRGQYRRAVIQQAFDSIEGGETLRWTQLRKENLGCNFEQMGQQVKKHGARKEEGERGAGEKQEKGTERAGTKITEDQQSFPVGALHKRPQEGNGQQGRKAGQGEEKTGRPQTPGALEHIEGQGDQIKGGAEPGNRSSGQQEGGGPAADSPAHRLLLAPVGGAGGGALQKAVFDQQAAEVGKVLIDPAQQPVDLLLRILSAGRELLGDGAEYDQLALLTGRPLAQGAGLVETGGQDGLPLLLSNGVARINHGRSGMGVAKAGIHRAGDAAGAQ